MSGRRKTFEADNVPNMGDPDRKRALNILAQRRYRQRQREKLRSLGNKSSEAVSPRLHDLRQLGSSKSPTTISGSSTQSLEPQTPQPDCDLLTDERHHEIVSGWVINPHDFAPDLSIPKLGFSTFENKPESSSREIFGLNFSLMTETIPTVDAENGDLYCELPSLELSQFTFPDESKIDLPIVRLINVGFTMAGLLGCDPDSLWDLTTSRVLSSEQLLASGLFLPPNLAPTDAQRILPHHPILDLLPWPSVRTKLVCVFNQPPQLRPPVARDPMALMQLVYDIDDDSEGFRVGGEGGEADAFEEKNWEVGQAFFRNWWWALDPRVIERSNTLRRERGASRLSLMPSQS